MSTFQTVKSQLQTLVDNANAVTGKNDANVTDAQASLIDGFAVLQEKTVIQNGVVTPDFNYNGLSKVTVNVPDRVVKLENKTITENGTYTADSGYDGLGSVTVEVESSGSGIVNGLNIMFYDEENEPIYFYSIKGGFEIYAPNYVTKKWISSDGTPVSFPFTPTQSMDIFANNETYEYSLYNHFGVAEEDYPYIAIQRYTDSTTFRIHFFKSIYGVNFLNCRRVDKSIPTDFSWEISDMVSYILANYTASHLSAEMSTINVIDREDAHYYSNFDMSSSFSKSNLYRLDE